MATRDAPDAGHFDADGGLKQSPSLPGTPIIGQSQLEVFAEAAEVPPGAPRKAPRPTYGGKTLPMPLPMPISDDEDEQDSEPYVWDAIQLDAASGGVPNVPYYLQLYGYDDEEIVKYLRGIATGIYASKIAPVKRHLKKQKV